MVALYENGMPGKDHRQPNRPATNSSSPVCAMKHICEPEYLPVALRQVALHMRALARTEFVRILAASGRKTLAF